MINIVKNYDKGLIKYLSRLLCKILAIKTFIFKDLIWVAIKDRRCYFRKIRQITNYELRITNYQLRIYVYELRP